MTFESFNAFDKTARLPNEPQAVSGTNIENFAYDDYSQNSSSSTNLTKRKGLEGWQRYPFNLSTYNPLTEWGDHYTKIFQRDLWPSVSRFDLLDVNGNEVDERHISGNVSIEQILEEDPDMRVFYCDSKLCDDLVTRASFCVDDLKKIFTWYDISIIFLDRFIGRNRCTVGSRKTFSPTDPSHLQSYDLWYDLPCRIYGAEHEYNWHFILFTVYVHYNVDTKKTVLFYIHRLGSEHPSFAELSSRQVKDRIKDALEHSLKGSNHLRILHISPFAIQLPTITCAVIFWTETLHKERLNTWAKEDEGKKSLQHIDTGYLHNVTRYVHSYKANILILKETLHLIIGEHEWFAKNVGHCGGYTIKSPSYTIIHDSLKAQCFQTQTILSWTDEVVKRTQILIDLYFNRMAEIDSKATANIAHETRKDAVAMRTIAFVTLFFLPATFVSAFFSMSFFQDGGPLSLQHLWLYFAFAIFTTICIIGVWFTWYRRKQRQKPDSDMESYVKLEKSA